MRTDDVDRLDRCTQHLRDAVARLHAAGWSDADLEHVIGRKLTAAHVRCVVEGVLPRELDAALRLAIEALAIIVVLPDVPGVDSVSSALEEGIGGIDQRVLTRVRGLLRKAESTEFPAEAEALTAKAQELIARHAIDALVLGGDDGGLPSSRRLYLDDPYVDAKSILVGSVAAANRCSAVYSPALAWSTVFGFPADLDAVELLVASLLAQAARALAREGSRVDAVGRSRTKSFRRSFLVGFAHRIGERLKSATDAQVAAVEQLEQGERSLLPALAARDERVEALQNSVYPRLTSRRTSVSNAAGWSAGQAAAEVADLRVGSRAVGQPGRG